MNSNMKYRYRAFRRGWGVYYCEDTHTGQQQSLATRDKQEASRLVHAKNEGAQHPAFSLHDAANRNPATLAHTNPATGQCRYGKLIYCGVGLRGFLLPRSGCRASGGRPGNGRRQNSSSHFLDAGASIG